MNDHSLTHSMVQSPSWEANWFAASQEIPCISRNQKVHYRTHKRPPPVCILGQPNPVHISTSHLMEVHPNIIHPSTPRSPQWSPSLRFPQQDPIHPPLLTHTRMNDHRPAIFPFHEMLILTSDEYFRQDLFPWSISASWRKWHLLISFVIYYRYLLAATTGLCRKN